MRTARLAVPLALLAFAPAVGQEPAKPDAKALAALTGEQLYPLKVGEKRTYRVKGSDNLVVMEVTAEEKIGDKLAFKVVAKNNGKEAANEHMRVTNEGVYLVRMGGLDLDPPMLLVKLPIKDGDTWDSDFKTQGKKVSTKSRVSVRDVKVPADDYKGAIVVESKAVDEDKNNITSTVWLVPKVGMVKQVVELNGEIIVDLRLELVERADK